MGRDKTRSEAAGGGHRAARRFDDRRPSIRTAAGGGPAGPSISSRQTAERGQDAPHPQAASTTSEGARRKGEPTVEPRDNNLFREELRNLTQRELDRAMAMANQLQEEGYAPNRALYIAVGKVRNRPQYATDLEHDEEQYSGR